MNRICRCLNFVAVIKSDLIADSLKFYRLLGLIRPVTRYDQSFLSDLLSELIVRIGDHLVRGNRFLVLLSQIMDCIAQRVQDPVSINGSIGFDLCIPVKRFPIFPKPSFKGIAFLYRICGSYYFVIFLNSLVLNRRSAAVKIKGYCKYRRVPPAIEHQIRCGHGAESIGCSQTAVFIPAFPVIITVHSALGRCGFPVISVSGDRRVELDIINGLQILRQILIINLIGIAVVIKVISSYVLFIVAVIERIANYLLGSQPIPISVIGLAIFFRSRIFVIICILKIIIYSESISRAPICIKRYVASVVQQTFIHNQLLGDITCSLGILLPSQERGVVRPGRRPFSGNILSDFCRKTILTCLS